MLLAYFLAIDLAKRFFGQAANEAIRRCGEIFTGFTQPKRLGFIGFLQCGQCVNKNIFLAFIFVKDCRGLTV